MTFNQGFRTISRTNSHTQELH